MSSGSVTQTALNGLTADETAGITGNPVPLKGTVNGAQIVLPYQIPEHTFNYAAATTGIVNTTTAVTIAAAAGSGRRNYLTRLQLATDTLGAATEFAVRDGAAGTVLFRTKLNTTAMASQNFTFDPPLRGTANTLMEIVTLTASVTGGVFANAQGYVAA